MVDMPVRIKNPDERNVDSSLIVIDAGRVISVEGFVQHPEVVARGDQSRLSFFLPAVSLILKLQ